MRQRNLNVSLLSLAVITSALLAAALSGCSSPSSSPLPSGTCITNGSAPLALVIGVRSNVPAESEPSYFSQLLMDAAKAQQPISVIGIDGQPQIYKPAPFKSNAQNSAAFNAELSGYITKNFANPVAKVHPKVAQADVLTALDRAAAVTGPDGNIIVVDSGLQTVAPLNYSQSDLLQAQPGDVVAYLRKQDLLPNLTGRCVVLSGFGYTASPQPTLNLALQNDLIAQWEAIVRASGARVSVDPGASTAAETPGLPPVSIVRLPVTPHFTNCGTIVLADAGSVGFVDGKATFRDPATAESTLGQLAAKLKEGTEHITLIGSTSSEGGDAVNNPLSLERATAVAKVLESMHIQASRITTVGDGAHLPGRVKDMTSGGVLLPGPAEQDREVIVALPRCA